MIYIEMEWWCLMFCIILMTLPSILISILGLIALIEDFKKKKEVKVDEQFRNN